MIIENGGRIYVKAWAPGGELQIAPNTNILCTGYMAPTKLPNGQWTPPQFYAMILEEDHA